MEFVAADLMEADEQLFRWLLESLAARKLYDRANAEFACFKFQIPLLPGGARHRDRDLLFNEVLALPVAAGSVTKLPCHDEGKARTCVPLDLKKNASGTSSKRGGAPMCSGDDASCPEFELHRQKLLDDLDGERRSFLKSAFLAGGGAAAAWAGAGTLATPASAQTKPGQPTYHYLPANSDTVHWGYFSKLLKPQLEVNSGDYITIEAVTHHAGDDTERLVKGDPGVESIYLWTKEKKGVNRRGAGPVDGKLLGRGSGEGFGVHICTGPVYIRGAEPGDILEVRIIDVKPRPCANPAYAGKSFGSNAAAWWGFHYSDLLTEPKPREVCTIYEIDTSGQRNWAQAVYNFRWVPQTDPFGVVHKIIDYPGVPVDHSTVQETHGILKNVRIPIRPHFGVMGLAPKEADIVELDPARLFRRQHR